jgi:hypothetical protein
MFFLLRDLCWIIISIILCERTRSKILDDDDDDDVVIMIIYDVVVYFYYFVKNKIIESDRAFFSSRAISKI